MSGDARIIIRRTGSLWAARLAEEESWFAGGSAEQAIGRLVEARWRDLPGLRVVCEPPTEADAVELTVPGEEPDRWVATDSLLIRLSAALDGAVPSSPLETSGDGSGWDFMSMVPQSEALDMLLAAGDAVASGLWLEHTGIVTFVGPHFSDPKDRRKVAHLLRRDGQRVTVDRALLDALHGLDLFHAVGAGIDDPFVVGADSSGRVVAVLAGLDLARDTRPPAGWERAVADVLARRVAEAQGVDRG